MIHNVFGEAKQAANAAAIDLSCDSDSAECFRSSELHSKRLCGTIVSLGAAVILTNFSDIRVSKE